MDTVIGVDFDNTIVDYNEVMFRAALGLGLVDATVAKSKKEIRDQIRQMPEGEIKWQELQASVYGKAMHEAVLIDGVADFFRRCNRSGVPVFIVSHKTKLAAQDTENIDLHAVALGWMREKRFFDKDGLGLSPHHVFFESTRQEKVNRIRQLECTHFIDDLEETFLEDSFPPETTKILYSIQREIFLGGDITVIQSWKQIYDYFFNHR